MSVLFVKVKLYLPMRRATLNVWFATRIKMSDIIPLEVSSKDCMKVYMLQSMVWITAKALNSGTTL